MLAAVPDPLRILMALGLTLLLVMLRFEAERFGAAEYDEPKDDQAPSLSRRLTWYAIGAGLVIAVLVIHPNPAGELFLGSGVRGTTILYGLIYGLLGAGAVAAWSWYRYGRVRLPEVEAYPGALVNDLVTAFLDEAIFRGALLGFLVLAGIASLPALAIQAIVYLLVTRAAAPGRDLLMLTVAATAAVFGGWVTILTGGFAAAFFGHAVMRIAVFLVTGHPGHPEPRGREREEIERRRRPPEGWRVIPTRGTPGRER